VILNMMARAGWAEPLGSILHEGVKFILMYIK
jgi:hypothetical protein